jgi:hypothetical protein
MGLRLDHPDPLQVVGYKRFAASTKITSDICQHPEFQRLHGTTSGRPPISNMHGGFPGVGFALSKAQYHIEPQGCSLSQWKDPKTAAYLPWEKKTKNRVVWRGSGVGLLSSDAWPWRDSQRFRLVNLTKDWGDETVDVLLPRTFWATSSASTVGQNLKVLRRNDLSHGLLDFGFGNKPQAAVREYNLMSWYERRVTCADSRPSVCSKEDGTCDTINREFPHGKLMPRKVQPQYRFIMDVQVISPLERAEEHWG